MKSFYMVKQLIFPRLSTNPQVGLVWNIITEWFKMLNSEVTVTIGDSVRACFLLFTLALFCG
jgi:hypothetical protein